MLEAINKLTTNFGYLFEEDLISEISELEFLRHL